MTDASIVVVADAEPSEDLPLVIGVDGGGTKTLAWVAQVDKHNKTHVYGKGFAGSSNQVAVGVETALENLAGAIEKACVHASITSDQIAAGVFALAGSGNPEAQRRVLHFLDKRFSIPSAQVIHDGQAVLEAGAPDGWGIAMIAGTGSVAFGKNHAGETAVVGGWGYWFGDEGSAYWLGQSGLRAIAQATDGRADATALTEKVLQRLEIHDPRHILAVLAEQGDTRLAIADLADLVCEAAEENDAVANSIFADATQHWLHHIDRLAKQLSIEPPIPVAVAGGVFAGSDLAFSRINAALHQGRISTSSLGLVHEPVAGCVLLAGRNANN